MKIRVTVDYEQLKNEVCLGIRRDLLPCFEMLGCLVGLLEMAPGGGLIPLNELSWHGTELVSVTQKWR